MKPALCCGALALLLAAPANAQLLAHKDISAAMAITRDYFTVPDREIRDIRSVLTVVGGRIVHEA